MRNLEAIKLLTCISIDLQGNSETALKLFNGDTSPEMQEKIPALKEVFQKLSDEFLKLKELV